MPLLYGSLFSGIGGIDLGFDRAGLKCAWQVEKDDRCRRWLEHYWPDADHYSDVVGFNAPSEVDVIVGGFPCQNLSSANVKTRNGLDGTKSGLWREFHRIVAESRPNWVVVENVSTWRDWVPSVRGDLWRAGYSSVPIQLCPSMFGSCHRRPRVFVVANANGKSESLSAIHAEVASIRSPPRCCRNRIKDFAKTVSRANGLPGWMARAYGNAVHVDVAEWIGRRLIESV